MLKRFSPYLPYAGLVLLALASYGMLLKGYFATDEWWAFSFVISLRDLHDLVFTPGAYATGANLLIYLLYKLFGVNALAWASITLLYHLANTIILYLLITRLSGRRLVGFIAAALFTVLPMGSQFLHQFSMMPNAGTATVLAMGSLLVYSYRRPIWSALLLLASFAFMPYTVPFIFLLALIEIFQFEPKKWHLSIWRLLAPTAAIALYYWFIKFMTRGVTLYDRPATAGISMWQHYLNILQKTYQGYGEFITFTPGTIVPAAMLKTSHYFVIGVIVLVVILLIRRQFKLAKTAIFGLLWIPASLLIFSTLNTVALDGLFPSRYFYVTAAGFGIVLASLGVGLLDFKIKKFSPSPVVPLLLTLAMVVYYLPQTRLQVQNEVGTGKLRRTIVETIKKEVPGPLGKNTLFCFTSDSGHYGQGPTVMPMPFVHSVSFNLGILYEAHNRQLRNFFTESGYFVNPAVSFYYTDKGADALSPQGVGFGTALNLQQCERLFTTFNYLKTDDVYGFAYREKNQELLNITTPLRAYLAGDKTIESQLYPWY